MIKVTHYSLLCGVLTLAACAEPAPPTDDPAAQGVETAMADAAAPRSADGRYAVGDRLTPAPAAAQTADKANGGQSVRTLIWDDLIPPDYDPAVILEGIDLDALADNDPRADQLLAELKAAWSTAPAVAALDGQHVRIPGFAVPLEGDAEQVTELLLVPYFGACIHVPPPPSNQIIHVFPNSPVAHDTLKDAVWIEGIINTTPSETRSGGAGYRLSAQTVSRYE